MQLLKDGAPVLTARSDHTQNNSGHDMPITYEGDLGLLWEDMDNLSVGILEGIMSHIAIQHGLTMNGDFWNMPYAAASEYVPSSKSLANNGSKIQTQS